MSTPTPTTSDISSSISRTEHSPTCTNAVPDQYGHVPIDACNSSYNFYPNFGGNLAFAALFGLTMVVHGAQAIAYKKKFCWVVIMGAVWECLSFILRTVGARNQQNQGYAIFGTLFLLLAPLWINAFVYMTVSRLVYFALPDKQIWGLKATWLTKFFVWLDILSFLVQAAGGIMMSRDGKNIAQTGKTIYMVGVGIQIAFIVVFGVLTSSFYRKAGKAYLERNISLVKHQVWAMYIVLVLIMVRCIFRLVEFSAGASDDNAMLRNENYTFFLDGLPMFLALILLNALHPGRVLRGRDSEFPRLTREEKKGRKQEKKGRKRQKKASRNVGREG